MLAAIGHRRIDLAREELLAICGPNVVATSFGPMRRRDF
jgi:hypothetical protein